jgi:hypothetical protein
MDAVKSRAFAALLVAISCLAASPLRAEIGDLTVRTSHPQYAGEGAFQTIEDCVRFATADARSEQDKAIAMYLWMLTHQWHLASPQEYFQPGVLPDTANADRYELMVFDANRARFSYGYGLCGTVHAWNEPYWKALGMDARRRAFPGHTNSEILYGGSWHAFDTDMAGLIFRADGVVAGYDDVVRDPTTAERAKPPLPCYPFAWPGDSQTMQAGWREIAAGGNWYKMYHSGYAVQPGVIHLRSGETFTRYFDRDHFGGATKRRFWHHQAGGPYRDWTFANQGQPRHEGAESNCRGNASYCNGEFIYRPNLNGESFPEGSLISCVAHGDGGKGLRAAKNHASIALKHFSPYVICGDPEDDANPMTGRATGGLVIVGRATGSVHLSISPDEGQSWQDGGKLSGRFERDVTDLVKGHYGWRANFTWEAGSGLDELRFTTVTQVCQAIYPRLTPGGTKIELRTASRAVVPVLPNFALADEATEQWEEWRSTNVRYAPRTEHSRFAYQTTNNKPGSVVFRIESPSELVEVSAAVRFGVRVPPPADCDYHLDLSLDGGQTWRPLAKAEMPADNEYSSGWMSGRQSIETSGVKTALVRATFYCGGYQTGLIEAQLYGLLKTKPPQAGQITFGWDEAGEAREFTRDLAAGAASDSFEIPTGKMVSDHFVRIVAQ